ncbi:hypothetical protein M426DRAFT_52103 [Hypoxylon sp. CI-4A]|nr:hypothetical protein M426DRAFT_52103 [Hypoxylon sp. CI-4A]
MTQPNREEIKSKVLESLKGTPYEASSLDVLSGGTANFIYRAALLHPLEDGTKEVLIKHSEPYIANSPDFKLTLTRCRIEEQCLKALSTFAIADKTDESNPYNFVVKAPKLFHFDKANSNQVQEYLQNGVDLKTYALETFAKSDSEATKQQCLQLGKTMGKWLRGFHDWTSQQPALRKTVTETKELRPLKHMVNYGWLLDRVKQFPTVLSDAKKIFQQVQNMANAELNDESQLHIIHGDFWSGNILLPNAPIQEGVDVPIFVIDWELSQVGINNLDLGQMIAELYMLKLYKSIWGGLWMVQGFVDGYGTVSRDFAYRTAIQVGVHLISFGTVVPGWGDPKQVENCARVGKEIIVNAWKRNRRWYEKSDLACLFSKAE